MSSSFDDGPLARWLAGDGIARLDALTGGASDVIGVIDRDLLVRYVSWVAPGLRREEVIGSNLVDLAPPGYRDIARATYDEVLETGNNARFEFMYRDGPRGLRIWEVRAGPIRDGDAIIGLIALSSNVTEQRQESADRDRFFSLSLDMLVAANPDGNITRANPAFGEALGYDVAELIGRPFMELVHADDRARTEDAFQEVLEGRRATDFENRHRHRDGHYRIFSWRATADPILGDVYAVARDITDKRATEEQLRQAQKMEAVGQLAGGVAHDFNNLLLAISANAELAARLTTHERVTGHLDEIQTAASRAAELTRQLLAFSRRSGHQPVPVDLNELTDRLLKMVRRLLVESIFIDWIPGHNLATVNADPSQLEQILLNLCVNAGDAMERGGKLTIETENVLIDGSFCEIHPWAKPGRYVLLSVTDTGVGMTAEVRERVFEPFFSTKEPGRGTGLGLATVYAIVQRHDGMIHVYSEPDLGTTMKVYLPADSRLAVEVGDRREPHPPRGRETILLAEDEPQVRRAVSQILEGAGYRTAEATDGSEAIRVLGETTTPVALAVLDVIMPVLDGPETWQQLRQLRPDLRVLFISGYADDRHRAQLPDGAEVLEKPFTAEQLLSSVRAVLDRE